MRFRDLLKLGLPPIAFMCYRRLRQAVGRMKPEWEYLPNGWFTAETDARISGWNVQSVLTSQMSRWQDFVERTNSTRPFDVSPESFGGTQSDLTFHNTIMCYAYVLGLVTRQRASISILDWGGALGQYYLISQRLFPGLNIDYHCKDVAVLASSGQTLWPQARFYDDDTCLERKYDFVLASCSLHYSPDWQGLLRRLSKASAGYLFVTRLPIVQLAASYVFVQRPYSYGYNTEYAGWCLNREEFLAEAVTAGLFLEREFVTGEQPAIAGAPESCQYRGYLFHSSSI